MIVSIYGSAVEGQLESLSQIFTNINLLQMRVGYFSPSTDEVTKP